MLTLRRRADITIDLLEALKIMDGEGFSHRGVKSQNMFVETTSPK